MLNYTPTKAILESILELQKNNRNITEQELATNIILIILSQNKELNLSQLCEYLNCPQAYLTHLIKRLTTKKLVNVRQDQNDLRFRYFSLSPTGLRKVKELDERYDGILSNLERNLSRGEISNLTNYLKLLCDAGGINPQEKRPYEHVIRPQQRRVAALLGVTGRTLFNEKISSTTLHLLRLVSHYNGILTLKNIADELSLKPTQVSSLLKQFHARKWINLKDNPFDDRSKFITLSAAGAKYLEACMNLMLSRVDLYLQKLSHKDKNNFAAILSRFVKRDEEILEVQSTDRTKVRAEIIRLIYNHALLEELPERVAGEKDRVFILKRNGETLCYLQQRSENNEINLVAWRAGISLIPAHDLLTHCVLMHSAKRDYSNISKESKVLALIAGI